MRLCVYVCIYTSLLKSKPLHTLQLYLGFSIMYHKFNTTHITREEVDRHWIKDFLEYFSNFLNVYFY